MVDAISDSKELFDAIIDPKRDPRSDTQVDIYTNNKNSPLRLLADGEIPEIVQGVISPIHQATADGVSICGGALHAVCMILAE